MCYYEQTRWSCGYWKWGSFRQQCHYERRMGETCGLKLVYDTLFNPGLCKVCEQIEKKERRVRKMTDDVRRWQHEGNRRATIEKTTEDIELIKSQISDLWGGHLQKQQSIN